MLHILTVAAALLLHPGHSQALPPQLQDRVGDAYEIRLMNTSETSSDDGSSGSSRSGGMLIERVVAVHDEGVELEFDLPPEATPEDRARDWQWPARVLKAADGSLTLLNAPELEARIDAWLVLGEFSREACGRWIFTWNAFKIECDPQTVLATLRPYDLRLGDLRDGAPYAEPGGLGPTSLRRASTGPEGSIFIAETPLDPAFVRRERAESDVVVAEIMGGEPVTLEAALLARSAEQVTGAITTTLAADGQGRLLRRTRVTHVTTDANGVVERATSTLTGERRRIEPAEASDGATANADH